MPIRLSGKEIVKALTKNGWTVERVSGSHHVVRHPARYEICSEAKTPRVTAPGLRRPRTETPALRPVLPPGAATVPIRWMIS